MCYSNLSVQVNEFECAYLFLAADVQLICTFLDVSEASHYILPLLWQISILMSYAGFVEFLQGLTNCQ